MPWNEIAAAFEPRDPSVGRMAMTGEAIKQHLAKLRLHRAKQGYHVPPKLDRNARRHAATVQACRRNAGLQTPNATPRKKSSDSAAKPSSLLASVSKTKQKKAEQAKKAAAGVVKPASAKRGRKSTNESPNGQASAGRRREANKDAQVPMGRVKRELPSEDDDLPLSKKNKTKRAIGGLMDDTMALLEGRGDVGPPLVASTPPQYGDTMALWEDNGDVDVPLVTSPLPQCGDNSSFTVPGNTPETIGWPHLSSGENNMSSGYSLGDEVFNPFALVPAEVMEDFGGLPRFYNHTSSYATSDPSQNIGMMPLSDPMPMSMSMSMPQAYNAFSQRTNTNPSSSFMDASVADYIQVPIDHNDFFDEQQLDDEEFDAPPNHLPDAYGYDYSAN